jgi:hypothetical protein
MKKCYISGAITGLQFDEVTAKFAEAEKFLIAQGFEVISPLKTGIPYSFPWESHIAMDIVLLIGCDAIYLLIDWIYSKGAMLEKSIAELTGKEIIYQEMPVFLDIKQAIFDVMGISYYDMVSKRRKREFVYARMIYAHYCKENSALVTEIAAEMKHNHSTVVYYLRKFNEEKKFNPDFREITNRIETVLFRTETPQISTQIQKTI